MPLEKGRRDPLHAAPSDERAGAAGSPELSSGTESISETKLGVRTTQVWNMNDASLEQDCATHQHLSTTCHADKGLAQCQTTGKQLGVLQPNY